ncbi:MAG: MgtC/SapB family protein [Bacteroidales bacterium]|nr:MgtC/SapB family protein [Bacteroidales bacterium]
MDEVMNLLASDDVNALNAVFKLTLSLLLGCIVGLERKRKGQIAGLRTFALISMGATLAMILSIYIPQEYMGLKNGDPGRVAAQVITGVGFLGAGAIIQMKGSVRGLTTAAGIWMVATIGMAVGVGMYAVSVIATLLIIFILVTLERYEHKLNIGQESKIVRVKVKGIMGTQSDYSEIFARHSIHVSDEYLKFDYEQDFTIINFVILTKGGVDFAALFSEIHDVQPTISITLTNEVNI